MVAGASRRGGGHGPMSPRRVRGRAAATRPPGATMVRSNGAALQASPPRAVRSAPPPLAIVEPLPAPRPTRPMDSTLILITACLVSLGLVMVFSASEVQAFARYGDQAYFLERQLLWTSVGLALMLGIACVDYHRWRHLSVLGMLATIAMLILVLRMGQQAGGAARWLRVGPVTIQPSELCKLALIVYIADWLSRRGPRAQHFFKGLLPFMAILGLVAVLVMRQPDMGTCVVILVAAVATFFSAGANVVQFTALGIVGAGLLGYVAVASPYRMARVLAFLNPFGQQHAAGYHIVQSLVALGSGGLLGEGLGASRQKFGLLPAPYTDSIFAVIGEELGLAGTLLVLALFVALLWRGHRVASQAPDEMGRLLAMGVTCWLTFQAFVHMAVATSTMPFTGITLPFISYGGSSMLVSFAGVGVLLSVSRFGRRGSAINRATGANGGWDGGPRVPDAGRGPGAA